MYNIKASLIFMIIDINISDSIGILGRHATNTESQKKYTMHIFININNKENIVKKYISEEFFKTDIFTIVSLKIR